MVRAVDLRQDPAPLIVGERVNTLGSRKVKRLALADDYEGMVVVAREQTEIGAHALDICMAMTERTDEREMLRALVKKLALNIEAPLVLDSTEADVLKDALEQYPGRAIINSINMENGRVKIDSVMPLAMAHGAAVVAMTIDEEGMAKTAERKVEAARKIHDIVVGEYGLAPEALIFDPLTFPLSTGDEEFTRSALETLEGIRRIEADMPGVMTILGISNVSFGLNPVARKIVNAVFLYHAVQAGLDLAIVHPSHVVPFAEIPAIERELAEDLVLARREDALARLIEHFEGREEDATRAGRTRRIGMTPEERLHYQIVHRRKEGIEEQIDLAVANRDPVEVLNAVLLPAMKEVGDKFGAGELILPFVLQSAEAMKRAVARLETYLERQEGVTKGTVVLATVYGDVHDIGKNLVNTILTNNGYTVHDLGKQVPVNRIIDKAVEVDATAIGLSALLVSTSKQMPLCVQELHRAGHRYPVIIGGAAINRGYAQRTLFVEEETPYEPGVFYAKDAFEGLSLMDRLVDPEVRVRAGSGNDGGRAAGAGAAGPGRVQRAGGGERYLGLDRARGRPGFTSLLGCAGDGGYPAGGGLAAPRPEDALPPPLGRQGGQGRGVGGVATGRFPAAPGTHADRGHRARLAAAQGALRVFPGQPGRQRPRRLQSGRRGAGGGAVHVPTATAARPPLPGRLLPAALVGPARRGSVPDRDRRRRGDRADGTIAGGRRLQRELLHPRSQRADSRGIGGLCARPHPRRTWR